MDTALIRSGRLHWWPVIAANMAVMTIGIGANPAISVRFSVAISCLASFAFLLNDLWDRDIDRVNHAEHFECLDARKLFVASTFCACFLVIGLGLAYRLGTPEFATACGIASAATAYTLVLRKYLLLSTAMASVMQVSPLWIPLLLWARGIDMWRYMFVSAIVMIAASREVLMDARDRPGDLLGNRDTVATRFGTSTAKGVSLLFTAAASLMLGVTVAGLRHELRGVREILAVAAVLLIGYFTVHAALIAFLERSNERSMEQTYINRYRWATLAIPTLALILWSR